jgi:hypothetical protein
VVETMASHRDFWPALGIGKALEEISVKEGTAYDSGVVDACLTLFQKKGFKFEEVSKTVPAAKQNRPEA